MIRRAAIVAALALCACEAVPDVVYDAGGGDAGAINTCPNNPPSYAQWCCGPIACQGANCVPTCSDCMAHCTINDLCCPTPQNRAVCRQDASTCP